MVLGLRADTQPRALKFIKEVVEDEKIYFLSNGEFAASVESHEFVDEEDNPRLVIPVWSKSYIPYARKWAPDLELREFTFQEFFDDMLNRMQGQGFVIGLNWNQNGLGVECTPMDLSCCLVKAVNGKEVVIEDLYSEDSIE